MSFEIALFEVNHGLLLQLDIDEAPSVKLRYPLIQTQGNTTLKVAEPDIPLTQAMGTHGHLINVPGISFIF